MFSTSMVYYKPSEIDNILCPVHFLKNNKKEEYGNVACSFDIEVSSFYRSQKNHKITRTTKPSAKETNKWEKVACMYCFVLGINGKCVIGRTWDEVEYCFDKISNYYNLDPHKRLIFYVHNLAYEFQFIRNRYEWNSVFSLDERKPVKAIANIGIEFRCSYQLSGYSLEHVGKNLTRYHVEKQVGDLNYSLIRHSSTYMSEKEINYVLCDGLVVMAYIQERIEDDGNITKIPLTKTGYVRKYTRNECLYSGGGTHRKHVANYQQYHRMMLSLKIKSINEYKQLKRAFMGGFTHASALFSGITISDVTSYDFTSSYPYCMVAFKYPMSTGKLVTIKDASEMMNYLKKYCCLFDVTFTNIKSIINADHPISVSKCVIKGNHITDNGRLVEGEEVRTTVTEQDYAVYRKFYKWDSMKVKNFRIYKKGYLPKEFVQAILTLYANKTKLKGLTDEESIINYMKSKEYVNACYGMTVTDICREEIIFENDEWKKESPDIEESLNKYNNSKNRFLFYPWGIWVTAYARRNLFTGIYEFGDDYLYADTDSIKARNVEKHMDYINNYNKNVIIRLTKAMEHHHLPLEMCMPKTIKGVEKPLGVWDFDGHYKHFKSLGAKRYMVEYDEDHILDEESGYKTPYSLTVSGLNKKKAIPYLIEESKRTGTTPFDLFDDELYVPSDATGKNLHTYIDYEQEGDLKDYTGKYGHYHEMTSVHMEGAEYSLSLSDAYLDYLKGIREYYE